LGLEEKGTNGVAEYREGEKCKTGGDREAREQKKKKKKSVNSSERKGDEFASRKLVLG